MTSKSTEYVCSGRPGRQSREERYVCSRVFGNSNYFVLRVFGNSKTPMQLALAPTLKPDIKFVSALNKKIISNACLWRLIRTLMRSVFSFLANFFPIGDPKKIKSNSTHTKDFCEKQGSKVVTFGSFFFPTGNRHI